MGRGLFDFWPRFGSVTGGAQPAPSPKPRQKSKILPPRRYIIDGNALANTPGRETQPTMGVERCDGFIFGFSRTSAWHWFYQVRILVNWFDPV